MSRAAICLLALLATAAAASGPEIRYYEPLVIATETSPGGRETLVFDAFGRRFELALVPNERWRGRGGASERFRGVLRGQPGSWFRLARDGELLHGLIHDGGDFYAIEPVAEITALSTLPAAAAINGIYRLDDLVLPAQLFAGDIAGAPAPASGKAALLAAADAAGSNKAGAAGATQRLSLAAIGDFEFFQDFGVNAEDAILTRLSTVDGIFSEQVDVEVSVDEVKIFNTINDPFTEFDSDLLLDELSDYRAANQTAFGHSHLLTGRDMTGDSAGIAWLTGICQSRQGAALTQTEGFTTMTSALILAHELGHNFGAPHDNESGSPCESTPDGFLMSATINGSSTFSGCSRNQMAPVIASAACITAIPMVDVAIRNAPAQLAVLQNANFAVDFDIGNEGSSAASNVTLDISASQGLVIRATNVPGASCTAPGGNFVQCTISTLTASSTRASGVTLEAVDAGDHTLDLAIAAADDTDTGNDTATVAVQADPAVDLAANFSADVNTTEGSNETLTLTVRNNSGGLAGSNVRAGFSASQSLALASLDSSAATCTLSGNGGECVLATLPPGQSFTVTANVVANAEGTSTLTASVSGDEADGNSDNNTAVGRLIVPVSGGSGGGGGGGGGGASGIALALLMAAAWRQRRKACWGGARC